MDVNGLVWRTF